MGQLVRENDFSCLCFIKPKTIVLGIAITCGRGGLTGRLYMRLTLQKQFVLPMLPVFQETNRHVDKYAGRSKNLKRL